MAGLIFLWFQSTFVWSGPNPGRTAIIEAESRRVAF